MTTTFIYVPRGMGGTVIIPNAQTNISPLAGNITFASGRDGANNIALDRDGKSNIAIGRDGSNNITSGR